MANTKWTHDELMVAVNLYCKIPFTSTRKTSPDIVKWANVIGRSPGALYTKLCNLGRFDIKMQEAGISGLTHGSKLDEIVWNEFEQDPENFIYESEVLLAKMMSIHVEDIVQLRLSKLPDGKMRETVIRQRVNQNFFRQAVLLAYNHHCCISGVGQTQLLEACHISSLASDLKNRTNPKNGLCMNSFFHRAYDANLIAITPEFLVEISDQLIETTTEENYRRYLISLKGRHIIMPSKLVPDTALLKQRYEQYIDVNN